MRIRNWGVVATLVLAVASCGEQPSGPVSVPVFNHGQGNSDNARGGNYGTNLSPDEEVMPAGVTNTSTAVGNAIFKLNSDGTELEYKLIVANIENVFQAHIHRAPAGTNGGIVVWLYPSTAPVAGPLGRGPINGVIAEGVITAANLVGSLRNQPLSALVAELENDGAYVNVHTNDGVAPTNTGPGDYPGGELRGQVEDRGH